MNLTETSYKYPRRGTKAWMMLNIIKHSGNKGLMRHEIMREIFMIMGRGEYSIIRHRGHSSSYFTTKNGQYGVIPKFCHKIGRRWIINDR